MNKILKRTVFFCLSILLVSMSLTSFADNSIAVQEYKFNDISELPNYVVAGKHAVLGTSIQLDSENSYEDSDTNSIYFRGWSQDSRVDFDGLFDAFNPQKGDKYKVSAYVKLAGDKLNLVQSFTDKEAYLTIASNEVAGTANKRPYYKLIYNITDNDASCGKIPLENEWTKLEMEYTVGDELPKYVGVKGKFSKTDGFAFTCFIDNVSVEKLGSVDPSLTEDDDNSDPFVKVHTFDKVVTVPSYVTVNKHIKIGSHVFLDKENNYPSVESGKNSLHISYWANYCRAYVGGLFDNFIPGKTYDISFKIKLNEECKFDSSNMYFGLFDVNNEFVYNKEDADAKCTQKITKDDWTTLKMEYTAVEGKNPVSVSFISDKDAIVFNVDDFICKRMVNDDIDVVLKAKTEANKIIVEGKLEEENENRNLDVYVLKDNFDDTDFSEDAVFAKSTAVVNSDGTYLCEVPMPATEKFYTDFKIIVDNVIGYENSYLKREYTYENILLNEQLVYKVSQAQNVAQVSAIMENEENMQILKLDKIEPYAATAKDKRQKVYEYIFNNKNNLEDFEKQVVLGSLLNILNGNTGLSFEKYIDKYAEILKISDKAAYKKTYSESDYKDKICRNLYGEYSNADDFADKFTLIVVKSCVNYSDTALSAFSKIADNAESFNLDLTRYNNLSSTNPGTEADAAQQFVAYFKSTDDYSNLTQQLNGIIDSIINNRGNGGSSSSGSAGGGSGKKTSTTFVDYATYEENTPVNKSDKFVDLDGFEWAKESISNLAAKQIISGYEDGTFKPNNFITRAEFCKIMCIAFEIPEKDYLAEFSDVSKTDWYFNYVLTLANNGLVNGNSGKFNPNDSITREDICTILYRISVQNGDITESSDSNIFNDYASVSDYAKDAVSYLSKLGVLEGNNGFVMPHNYATRAECVKLVDKFIRSR